MIKKFWLFFCNNMAFLLTLIITYVFCSFVVYLTYIHQMLLVSDDVEMGSFLLENIMSNLIPTTFVYVLGCIIVNIIDIAYNQEYAKINQQRYPFNIVTLVCLFGYAFFYFFYMINRFSLFWFVSGMIVTFILLALNVQSYKEMNTGYSRSIA